MGAVFALIYLIGMVGSVMVGRARAGLSQIGRLSMATVLTSFEWTVHQFLSTLFWPFFLAVWLIRGRPESPWSSEVSQSGTIRIARSR